MSAKNWVFREKRNDLQVITNDIPILVAQKDMEAPATKLDKEWPVRLEDTERLCYPDIQG